MSILTVAFIFYLSFMGVESRRSAEKNVKFWRWADSNRFYSPERDFGMFRRVDDERKEGNDFDDENSEIEKIDSGCEGKFAREKDPGNFPTGDNENSMEMKMAPDPRFSANSNFPNWHSNNVEHFEKPKWKPESVKNSISNRKSDYYSRRPIESSVSKYNDFDYSPRDFNGETNSAAGKWENERYEDEKNWEASKSEFSKPEKRKNFSFGNRHDDEQLPVVSDRESTNGKSSTLDASILDRLDQNDWYFGKESDFPVLDADSNLKIDLRELWGYDETRRTGSKNGRGNGKMRKTRNVTIGTDCECVDVDSCSEEEVDAIVAEEEMMETDRGGFHRTRCEKSTQVCCRNPRSGQSMSSENDDVEEESEPLGCGQTRISRTSRGDVGDAVAEGGEFPWLLNLVTSREEINCGASLIRPRLALTAAHCINRTVSGDLFVQAGVWNANEEPRQTRKVIRIAVHPGYDSENSRNDIAMLLLEKGFETTDSINPICLPVANDRWNSRKCRIVGWTSPPFNDEDDSKILNRGIVRLLRQRHCQRLLLETESWQDHVLHDSFFCGIENSGKRSCLGQEGSPIVCPSKTDPDRFLQIGLVSKSINCDESGTLGIFTNVLKFLDWANEFAMDANAMDEIDFGNA